MLGLTVALTTCSQPTNTKNKPAKAKKATESKADASSTKLADVQEITINNNTELESLDPLIE